MDRKLISRGVKTILKADKNGYAGLKNQSEQVKSILKVDKNGYAGKKSHSNQKFNPFGVVEN